MAAINSGSNNSNSNSSAGGSNMYRVGDYVYFEAQQQQQQQQQQQPQQSIHQQQQQQQPFQIRRIEELNKTAGGNVEAKVMCFYRRRDLPAQLVALADKHQQHQQQQQLSLTLSLSPGGSSTIKGGAKQMAAIKGLQSTNKDTTADKKEQDIGASGTPATMKKEQRTEEEQTGSNTESSEVTEVVKEEQQQQDVEMAEVVETDNSVVKNDAQGDEDGNDKNDKSPDTGNEDDKTSQAQQQHDWWRGEQLKQRELFLSRQVETLAATHIRGKCTVTLYNETESLDSYLEREDTFFYCLVFDPVQKTLLADKGEIRVGHKYQAEVPPKALYSQGNIVSDLKTKDITTTIKGEMVKEEHNIDGVEDEPMITECSRDDDDDDEKEVDPKSSTTIATVTTIGTVTAMESDSDLETLIWTCRPQWNRLTDRQIDQFLVVSRSLGTFARALDCTSSVKQPSLHMSAAAASRDITLFHAMDTLHRHGYDLGAATCSLVPSTGPVLCRDEMEEWSASEANLFEEALEKYGKDFGDIRHDFLPWKTHKNIVEYYYMWKTTDRYVQQKRVKAVEQESKLKQVYIPSYNGTTSSGKHQAITSAVTVKSSQQQLVNGNSAAVELYSPKNGSGSSAVGDGPLLPGMCDLCDVVASQQWYPNTIATPSGAAVSYHQQNGGLSSMVSSTLCHECWTHWKKYGGPRIATSDKKVISAGRGGSISGDEDRPHSNTSSSSAAAAMNLNISASGGRSSSHAPTVSAPHHHHHLMHLNSSGSGHHSSYHQPQHHHHQQLHHQQQSATTSPGGSGLLLHQPHINSSGSSTTVHRCTIIGCQAAPFKSKSQLLRHYSTAHGIGINANSSSSPSAIINSTGSGSRSSVNSAIDGGSGTLSPQPQQQQTNTGSGLLHHSSGGPLNLNNSSSSIQHSNAVSNSANQIINLVASSSSPQQQPNNLSTSGIAVNNVVGAGGAMTATGRPVMKTRTAFYLRCTSLAKASRRRAAQQATAALSQLHQKKSSSNSSSTAMVLSPIASATVQPGCLARPRNVARRPFICVPQAAHTYKNECMLSMQHAPVQELKAYLRAAAIKSHARRPGVTRVANALIATRRGRGGMSAAADLAVPDWLSLPSQQHQHQSSHHHISSSSKHGKHSSRTSTGGRVAFPKPPKAPDGSLLYERVPNKQEAAAAAAAAALNNPNAAVAAAAAAAAVGLNPAAAAAILGALGPPGSVSSGNTGGSGSSNDPSAGFDVAAAAAAIYQQQQQQQQHQQQQQLQGSSSTNNKRRLYETDGAVQQPQPQAGPPSKRMHRQHHSQQQQSATGHHHHNQHQTSSTSSLQGGSGAGGGAVDGMLASIVAHQQQQQQRGGSTSGGPLQLTATGGKSGAATGHQQSQQQHNHYRTPSMARTGRKHVISWTDAPDDLYYRCTALSRSLRKSRMTGRELRRSARKPWQPIAALLGISFTMPSTATSSTSSAPTGTTATASLQNSQSGSANPSISGGTPFDMSTGGNSGVSGSRQSSAGSNQSSAAIAVSPCASGTPTMSSSRSNSHH